MKGKALRLIIIGLLALGATQIVQYLGAPNTLVETRGQHKVDSSFILGSQPFWPMADSVQLFTHSIGAGLNATPLYSYFTIAAPFNDSSFANMFARQYLGVPLFNHGVAGIGSMDALMIAYQFQSYNNRSLTITMNGRNNTQSGFGQVYPQTFNKYANANKAIWVNGNMKRIKAPNSADSVKLSGSWVAYTTVATYVPEKYASVGLSETKTGTNARLSTTIGDSAVWTSPVDTSVVVMLLGWYKQGGTVQIFIDNNMVFNGTTNGRSDSTTSDIYIPYGARVAFPLVFTGLSNTSHKVKVVNVGGGKLVIDYFGNLRDSKYAYPYIFMEEIDNAGALPLEDSLNLKLDSMVAALPSGYPTMVFKTNQNINWTTGASADNVHPNNSGHREIDSGLIAQYTQNIYQGPIGSFGFSNAPYFRRTSDLANFRRMAEAQDIGNQYVPLSLSGDGRVFLNGHNFYFYDSAASSLTGGYIYMPNLFVADSGQNTYITINAQGKSSSNSGIRVNNASSANANPSFMDIGGNDQNWGSPTSANTGGAILFDFRSVTAPIRFSTKANGTGTSVINVGIHGDGELEVGGVNAADIGTGWVQVDAGTSTRAQWVWKTTTPTTSPIAGGFEDNGLQLLFTGSDGARGALLGTKATADLTAQSSTGTVTSYAVPGSGSANGFDVSGYIYPTAIATDVIQLQVAWTDENSNSRTQLFYIQGQTTGISTTGSFGYSPIRVRAKQGTTITVSTTLTTGGGTITFDAGASIVQVN